MRESSLIQLVLAKLTKSLKLDNPHQLQTASGSADAQHADLVPKSYHRQCEHQSKLHLYDSALCILLHNNSKMTFASNANC